MSKVIKVEHQVYDQLNRLRVGRETFSDVIEELLTGRNRILEAISMLEGCLKYRQWQEERAEKLRKAGGG